MAPVAADSKGDVRKEVDVIDSQIREKENKIVQINTRENGQWEKGDVNPQITLLKSQIYDLCKKRQGLIASIKK